MVLENSFNKLIKARHGTILYNKNDIYIGKSIEKYGEFSYLEAKIFEQICKAGDVVIEVGANIGAHILSIFQNLWVMVLYLHLNLKDWFSKIYVQILH